MAEYYMILTVAGQAAYARAGAGGSPVQISAVAVGDGGGVAVQPAESWVSLIGEVWRGAPTLVEVDATNPRLVLVEAHVPHNVGGWYAREIGLLSPDGVLLAVGNYPESYKPVLDSGVGKELMIRAYIEHGNASQTTLKINPDIVMASRTYVVSAVAAHDASPTAHAGQLAGMSGHIDDLGNPHQVTAVQVGAERKGAVLSHDEDAGAHGGIAPRIMAAVAGHNESGTAHEDIRLLAARPIIDMVARDQIALTNLRQIVNTAVTTGALVQGRMWELLTSEWATGSTGFAFMTGSPGYYTNLLQSVVGNPLANGTTMGAGQVCCIDLNCVLPAGKLMSAQVYAASPQAGFKVEVWRQVSGNQYSFVGQSQIVSLVAGLNTIVFTTPIDVQAGDRLGTYNPTQDVVFYSTTAGSRLWVNADPTTTTTFNAGSGTVAIQGTVLAGTGDMVLVQPAAIPLATAPAYADTYCLYKDDSGSAVLGTDLVVEMSRDNGGTWTPASSYVNETGTGGFDGTYAAIKARCNLSAQPSGTSLRSRIKTLNTKAQRVAAPAVYAE